MHGYPSRVPIVECKVQVNAPVSKVVEIARDVEKYPEFMPDVKSLKLISRSDDGTKVQTEWVGKISQFGLTVKWSQEENWDFADNRVDFAQIEGDYDKMVGWWKFTPNENGTEFTSSLDYEYNVPLLGALVQKVVKHIVTLNVESAMNAIKKRAEES